MSGFHEPIEIALEHLAILQSHLDRGSIEDQLIFDAVCQRLAAAIEALSHLPEDKRMELFGSDWPGIWSTRNRISHGYVRVSQKIIRATVEGNVPAMILTLECALGEAVDSESGEMA